MRRPIKLEIQAQPDDTTCGPTCLHAVYRYYEDDVSLEQVISETPQLTEGGTLAAVLSAHALRRGYQTTLYTFNLNVFDPTWFQSPEVNLIEKLEAQQRAKNWARLQAATPGYIEHLKLGGRILFEDLTGSLIRRFLNRRVPILTGLSSTYLYAAMREFGPDCHPDDVRGAPAGHFVVLCGYDKARRKVRVADPYLANPLGEEHYYDVSLERLVCAILLGVLTYDANLLIVEPRRRRRSRRG